MHIQVDTLTQIRQYLTDKSADELVDLLMDLSCPHLSRLIGSIH